MIGFIISSGCVLFRNATRSVVFVSLSDHIAQQTLDLKARLSFKQTFLFPNHSVRWFR